MLTCAAHPQRETGLSCGECGTPLCVDCAHHTNVGTRCTNCMHGHARLPSGPRPALVAHELRRPQNRFLLATAGTMLLSLSTVGALLVLPAALIITLALAWREKMPSAHAYAAGLVYLAGCLLLVAPSVLQSIGSAHAKTVAGLHVSDAAATLVMAACAGLLIFLLRPAWRCSRELYATGRTTLAGVTIGAAGAACIIGLMVTATLFSVAR